MCFIFTGMGFWILGCRNGVGVSEDVMVARFLPLIVTHGKATIFSMEMLPELEL